MDASDDDNDEKRQTRNQREHPRFVTDGTVAEHILADLLDHAAATAPEHHHGLWQVDAELRRIKVLFLHSTVHLLHDGVDHTERACAPNTSAAMHNNRPRRVWVAQAQPFHLVCQPADVVGAGRNTVVGPVLVLNLRDNLLHLWVL